MRTTCAESSGCDLRMQILRFYRKASGDGPRNLGLQAPATLPASLDYRITSRASSNRNGLVKPRLIPGALEPRLNTRTRGLSVLRAGAEAGAAHASLGLRSQGRGCPGRAAPYRGVPGGLLGC